MKLRHALLALSLLVPTAAFAAHCPADMKKIDALLEKGVELSPEELSEVKALRAEGERLHKEGKHGESVEVLAQALEILGAD